jgi:hypothetical protein
MANEKIYVVTSGCYSDYHIVAATLDKDIAEKIAAKFSGRYDECEIEEYCDAEIMLKPAWNISFDKAGNVINTYGCESEYDYENIGECCERRWGECALNVSVSADDLDSAIKIAAEKRAKYLAEKLGL